MKVFDLLTRTPFSQALGWTLFHSLWEGIIIAAVLAAVLALVRSPRFRYGAACAALLAMVTTFAITLLHFLPANDSGARGLMSVTLLPWRELSGGHGNSGPFSQLTLLIPWLAPMWLMGVCFFYLRYAAGWQSLYKLRRRGVCHPPVCWQHLVERLAIELKIARPVVLLESLLADTPVVLGHFRPLVLVPVGFLTGLPPEYVEAILVHELAHIRRSDYILNVCQRLIEGLLFYHPAAWWISHIIHAERENCCDDTVVALRGDPHGYAMALNALEQNRSEQQWLAREAAVAATGGKLMKRIKRLLYPRAPSGIWAPVFAAFVLMASTAMVLAAWQVNPGASLTADQTNTTTQNPWQKWLNEDVVYIISDKEKAAFERLNTDEERQMFVGQFWLRLDPTPATPENEFKAEHYRRIVYANKHFKTASGTPGWRTDRGHMYIVYGPPDEIDAHPKTAASINGTELWRYRYVEGLGDNRYFTFIDRTGSGDYRLAPGTAR